MKLLQVLDMVIASNHAKFELCQASNICTAILIVCIIANSGRNESSFKQLKKCWNKNWNINQHESEKQQTWIKFVKELAL